MAPQYARTDNHLANSGQEARHYLTSGTLTVPGFHQIGEPRYFPLYCRIRDTNTILGSARVLCCIYDEYPKGTFRANFE